MPTSNLKIVSMDRNIVNVTGIDRVVEGFLIPGSQVVAFDNGIEGIRIPGISGIAIFTNQARHGPVITLPNQVAVTAVYLQEATVVNNAFVVRRVSPKGIINHDITT